MREHIGLFRGKRIDNEEWVEGVYMPAVDNDPPYIFCSPRYGMGYGVDPTTVGECTSLKDKNGNLIFEGDIVIEYQMFGGDRIPRRVVWDEETLQFKSFYVQKHRALGTNCIPLSVTSRIWEVEIIGNIHDNPELLKGGEG